MEPTWWLVFFAFIDGVGLTCASPFIAYLWSERRYVDVREMYDGENTHG